MTKVCAMQKVLCVSCVSLQRGLTQHSNTDSAQFVLTAVVDLNNGIVSVIKRMHIKQPS